MNLSEARALYLEHLLQRGKAKTSITAAAQTLAGLERASKYGGAFSCSFLTTNDIEGFLYGGSFGPATFNRYRSVLNGFFSWLQKQGEIQSNPVATVEAMPAGQPKPKLILSPTEMLRMLDNSNPVERIALALGMNTGLRASDIVSLTVGDVDLASGYLATTIQKTKGLDRKPITRELAGELLRWFCSYTVSQGHAVPTASDLPNDFLLVPSYTTAPHMPGCDPVLHTRPHQKLTHPHRIVQRALAREGFDTAGEGFHTLRRSSARALFEQLRVTENADHALMVVKEFLNHKSTADTEVYLGINHERAVRDEMLRGKSFLSERLPSTSGTAKAANRVWCTQCRAWVDQAVVHGTEHLRIAEGSLPRRMA